MSILMSRSTNKRLRLELQGRFNMIMAAMEETDPNDFREKVSGKYYWQDPEEMCRTMGSTLELRLAVDDFKAILSQVRALK